MHIEVKEINKHGDFISKLQDLLNSYMYLPTSDINSSEVDSLTAQYFPADKPIYSPQGYTFLRSFVDIQLNKENNTASFIINGYDFYTNDNYDVIIVVDDEPINHGPFEVLLDTEAIGSIRYTAASAVRKYLKNQGNFKVLLEHTYNLKNCEYTKNIDFSYEELLHIYKSIQDALRERYDKEDKSICHKILSYLHSHKVLTLDEWDELELK